MRKYTRFLASLLCALMALTFAAFADIDVVDSTVAFLVGDFTQMCTTTKRCRYCASRTGA
jgi:hypothetical protein